MSSDISVVALCYNHQNFVLDCLESIRSQTFTNFQLIVTDDFSRDESPILIESWIARYWPSAIFIRHEHNVGLCTTLNEALSHATGRYISMIATDDTWELDKLERQFFAMEALPAEVAVIYSDAYQMDESGVRLDSSFLEAHGLSGPPPQGEVFSRLADGNFIPAMTTLIRTEALRNIGGYDESLTYEDYDMWLRLAVQYRFAYYPAKLANYRRVSTSMVRTLFEEPTPAHAYTIFLIAAKWLRTDRLSPVQRKRWVERLGVAAHMLYRQDDSRAAKCLWSAFLYGASMRCGILALTRFLGLSRKHLKFVSSVFSKSGS